MKIYTLFVLFVVALSSCAQNTPKTTENIENGTQVPVINNISQEEFKKNYENKEGLQILDVRTPEEIAAGKIGEAKELDIFDPKFAEKVASLDYDKDQPVVIYCRSGGRSLKASQIFIDQGFTKVYNLLGGYSNY